MLTPQIEDNLDVTLPTGGARRGDGPAVLAQPEGGADEVLQLYLRRYPEGELEATDPLAPVLLDPVGVGPGEPDLFEPQGTQVQAAPRAGHPYQRGFPAGAGEAHRVLHRPR